MQSDVADLLVQVLFGVTLAEAAQELDITEEELRDACSCRKMLSCKR